MRDKVIETRDKTIDEMHSVIGKLHGRRNELEARLRLHDNAHTPPSKKLPSRKKSRTNNTGRKQGG